MSRPALMRLRVESLEDRSVPAFVTASSFAVGPDAGENSKPDGITTADFNRDGKLDVATANTGAGGVSVLLGLGNGKFGKAINIGIGRNPVGIRAADVNGDGKADLVTANQGDNSVSILIGNGLGGFSAANTITGFAGPVAIAAADFTGDGKLDLAVANNGSNTVALLFGLGTGTFNNGGTITVRNGPTSIAVGDFDGDQKPDIATVSGGHDYLDINLNIGGGSFGPAANFETGFCGNSVAVADFNHDGNDDVAVACVFPSGDGVSILLGQGDGTFPTFTNYDAGNQTPRSIVVADFNGDGHADVVTANDQFGNNSVTVLTGVGDGTLNPAAVFASGMKPLGVAVGDFNRDGLADAVTTNHGFPVEQPFGGPIGTVAMLLGNGDGTLGAAGGLDVDIPKGNIAADFTGDNKPDLAVVTGGVFYSGVTVFPSLGNGLFGERKLTPSITQPVAVAAADFDGDLKRDLAVATAAGVSILLGNGDGTFGDPVATAVSGSPTWISTSNFNGDLHADLVVATGNGVSILLGNGDGSFQAPVANSAGGAATHVAVGDFNKDSKQDLAVVNDPNDSVTVLFGQGNGSFTFSDSYPTRVRPGAVSVGDFNKDGKPDLAVPTFFGNGGSSAMAILMNGVSGKFTQRFEYDVDSRPVGSVAADFTGDGKIDVVTASSFADTLSIYPGSGTGAFSKPIKYVVGNFPTWVTAADFNGDNKLDLAIVNSNSGSVTLLATPTAAHHVRVNVSAAAVTAGQSVTVTVAVVDSAGRPVRSFAGTVTFSSTDRKALLPGPYTFTPTDQGIRRFVVVPKTAGSQNVMGRSSGLQLGTGTVQVAAATASHVKLIAPTIATAGTAFDMTVQARDRYGNVAPSFTGTVHFTSTDPNLEIGLPADYTFTPTDAGSHTFTGGATLLTAGARTITAASGAWKSTARVNVRAGVASRFLVTGLPTTVVANKVRSFAVTALDAYGNRATGYLGTVRFENSGGLAVLPAQYTFKALARGKHVFKVTFQTPGADQALMVSDMADPNIAGSVTGITVV